MPISIDWGNSIIYIPQSYLANISGTLYELDTEQFRLDLKALEDDEEGMAFPDTHIHNTEVTVAGVTYARFIQIIAPYSLTFEDGQYSVRLSGSNNNFFDVENGILNQNQVQIIPGNSAGLIKVESGISGLTQEESNQLMATAVEDGGRLQAIDTRLPSDPADQSQVEAAIASATAGLAQETTVSARPTLDQIEASSILSKQAELLRAIGLMQENFRLKDTSFDVDNNMTQATVLIYANATDAEADQNAIAEYSITAVFNGAGKVTSYLSKRVV